MKAAVLTKYNKNNINLEIQDIKKPEIEDNEVLVKVSAAGVNPVDNMISRGEIRMIIPYKLPQIAGNELVGEIVELGKKVTDFNTGDRVFTRLPLDKIGAFSEYVAVQESAIAKVPEYLTDIEAAAIPLTALTVMQSFQLMNIEKGGKIFISGGTGGVGAMAIPLAKAKGLDVITNGNMDQKERVLSLGADKFLDYKTEDYVNELSEIDYVIDTIGGNETEKQMKILKPGGKIVSLKGMPDKKFAKRMNLPTWKQFVLGIAGHKLNSTARRHNVEYNFIYVHSDGKLLSEVSEIFNELKIKPSIDSVFSFEDVNKALSKIANSRSKGKTVINFKK